MRRRHGQVGAVTLTKNVAFPVIFTSVLQTGETCNEQDDKKIMPQKKPLLLLLNKSLYVQHI